MGIPGSFEFSGSDKGKGQISYRLKALCRARGVLKPKMSCFQLFSVADRTPASTVGPTPDDNRTEVSKCCIVSSRIRLIRDCMKGTDLSALMICVLIRSGNRVLWLLLVSRISINAHSCRQGSGFLCPVLCGVITRPFFASQPVYVPGEVSQVFAECHNRSRDHISRIRISLRRHVYFSTEPAYHSTVDVSDMVEDVDLGRGASQAVNAVLPIPAGIQHSFNGRLIRCSYDVVCRGMTDGCCNSNVAACNRVR